jgi:hypothetical protein
LKQQMQIWAHVRARCMTYGRNTYKDLEGGNQRLSSHTENVESQTIGIFVGMWYGRRWCRRWKQGIDEQCSNRLYLWCVRCSAQMSTTKIVNAIIDDPKLGRLNPNINF